MRRTPVPESSRIGIVGAGLTGLTAGRALARAGHRVTLCESEALPGGLAGTFAYGGTRLEVFYHHAFTSDEDTVSLIKEAGLWDQMQWRETPMGIYQHGKLMKFATPMDLLKFTPLSFANRIRFGLVILYLSRVNHWQKYETQRAEAWIKRAFGQQAWDVVWGPLMHGKFGDLAPEIGMPWFYSRVNTRARSRGQGMAKESLGYLKGSYQVLHDQLAADIKDRGGEVRCQTPVKALIVKDGRVLGWKTAGGEERFDAVLATPAPPVLFSLLPKDITGTYWDNLRQVQYLGNVCAVLTMRRSLSPIYWMNIPDVRSPFIAVIEHTNFIPRDEYQGRHTVYLSSYLPTDHPRYRAADAEVLKEFYAYLPRIISDFTPADVLETRVFRAPYAQPVMRPGQGARVVDLQSPLAGLYVATMAQIYPEDRGMAYSIKLGRRVADRILTDQRR